jgi:hypothetical protein
LSKMLTHPVQGLDQYKEMMNLLINDSEAVKVYVDVSPL